MSQILMPKDKNLGPRQAGSVDDRGMVQFVRDDEIFFAEDRRNRSGIGGKA